MSTHTTPAATAGSKPGITAVDIAYIAVFAAIFWILGFVSIPVGTAGVPIVLQNAVAILAGLVLGARRGTASVVLILLIGLAFPVLAGGRTTLYALGSPTAGYLVGYIISAAVAGAIAYSALRSSKAGRVILFLVAGYLGLALQYLFGVFGLMLRADLSFGAAWLAQVPFLPADAAKIAVMVIIALAVHAAFPDMRRR